MIPMRAVRPHGGAQTPVRKRGTGPKFVFLRPAGVAGHYAHLRGYSHACVEIYRCLMSCPWALVCINAKYRRQNAFFAAAVFPHYDICRIVDF